MIPLFLVYFAEYAMQSGTWTAIGAPAPEARARRACCFIKPCHPSVGRMGQLVGPPEKPAAQTLAVSPLPSPQASR